MGIARYIGALVERARRWAAPRLVEMPSRIFEDSSARIEDGVNYAQPRVLTMQQRATMTEAQLKEWANAPFGDQRATYNMQFDTPGRGRADLQVMPTTEDPLTEWNWSTRQYVLSTCHSAYERNPLAKRAVHYVSAFVVGNGFNLTCKNKEVEALLQTFVDSPDNCIREYERQAVIDLLLDGELFLRFFAGSGDTAGEIVAVPLRPWEVQYIHTEPGFFRRPLKYHMQPYTQYNIDDPQSAEANVAPYDIPANEVLHVAINRHAYELRGRSELYSALPWLRAHKEWLENRARQNHWRGALLWHVSIASATVDVIGRKLAQYQRPPTPGSTVVTSDKEVWNALTNPVGAGDAGEDGRQIKIMALNGVAGIPEYMTGDGENANLASTKSQQLPVLKTFEEFQTIMIEQVWYPMFKRVLQAAIDAGLIDEEVEEQDADGDPVHEEPPLDEDAAKEAPTAEAVGTLPAFDVKTGAIKPVVEPKPQTPVKKIKALDAFDVQYEPIGDNEPFTLMQALDSAMGNEILSKQSATTEMGWDYAIEQKRIRRERKQDNEAIARGEKPAPPEMIPQGMGDDEEDAEEEPEKQGAVT